MSASILSLSQDQVLNQALGELEYARKTITHSQREYSSTHPQTIAIALKRIESSLISAETNLQFASITDESIHRKLRMLQRSHDFMALRLQQDAPQIYAGATEAEAKTPAKKSTPAVAPPAPAALVEEVDDVPFFNSRPIGIRNASNNCWINAEAQFGRAIPSLYKIAHRFRAFRNFYTAYDAARDRGNSVARGADSQALRTCLRSHNPYISSDAMEDAHEGLMPLMEHYRGPKLRIQRRHHIEETTCSTIPVHIDRHNKRTLWNPLARERPLVELVSESFMTLSDDRGGGQASFHTPPEELFFQLLRFTRNGRTYTKNNAAINCGMRFTLPATKVLTKESGEYACDAFISHLGKTLEGGHYVVHIKVDVRWYLCNDQTVAEVTETEATLALKSSYILHYRKC